ncbi:antitoxin Xre-like helix-turn-helix domain-containing protein [Pseudogulbenkiania subflava]|uniref:Putative toxin-antitoxin system antitoxin component, TIGR02293 family n=1 Tax=Pseudogulbenkiania subflava DSM 22618 TaxID=1123014 RepID=A0A1Y6CCQ3_9NEIS|nr:antitoxin Xre-like helix-turn-helix domain-containing protein [Pseudogulbenkiania subflava]SMF23704.1 putative toxin-antitoxin system antitoxin component, TIGR02293 family [Pseudogulbenkiania subflava DSM 22618]SMF33050.1 putative toxin-antitoxin system antitoxin component, TIGR02293 family [Pseudogulbenkiania subflava DSM 22618]SMF48049.1 putative toxin-antitoxin system antitoxin component, TIGR02293 family [Pseudogulbenkiania subflava DSM 22618]
MQGTVCELVKAGPAMQVAAIRQGLSTADLAAVQEDLGLPLEELCVVIGVAERTFTRQLTKEGRLDSAASERLLRLVTLVGEMQTALGSKERAVEWLTCHHDELECRPITLVDTAIGTAQVRRIIRAIEHGLPV